VTRNTEMSWCRRSRRTASGSPTRASAPLVIRGPRRVPVPPWPRSRRSNVSLHVTRVHHARRCRRPIRRRRNAPGPAAPAHAWQMGDVVAGEVDGAGVWPQVAGELAHQRGLAGAIGADQGMDLAGSHVDRDVVVAIRPPKRLISPVAASSGAQP